MIAAFDGKVPFPELSGIGTNARFSAALRAAGQDPGMTPDAQRRRAASASEKRRAVVTWRDDGSLDAVDFRRDILPKLQGLPVRA
jgi:hypothetical protein